MRKPSETALRGRARTLLVAMTDRAKWIYAIPPAKAPLVRPMLEAEGMRCEEEDAAAKVARFVHDAARASFVLFDSPELEVAFVECEGEDGAPLLAQILEKTGFFAQSTLLGTALDVRDEEAPKALRTLAHMVVSWDEDWSDLFLLHLASPDPIARHGAVAALCVAAMVARETEAAIALLTEAQSREKFPKLRDTIGEAIALLTEAGGGAVDAAKMPEIEPI